MASDEVNESEGWTVVTSEELLDELRQRGVPEGALASDPRLRHTRFRFQPATGAWEPLEETKEGE